MPRRGADLQLDQRLPRHLRGDDNARDIFALVKMNMSDKVLCQDPLLVWPTALLPDTERFFGSMNDANSPVVVSTIDPDRGQELSWLADALAKDYPHMNRAVAFYNSLLDERRPRVPFPEIRFVRAPKAHVRWAEVNLGERAPPPKPHHLQVVFHR